MRQPLGRGRCEGVSRSNGMLTQADAINDDQAQFADLPACLKGGDEQLGWRA